MRTSTAQGVQSRRTHRTCRVEPGRRARGLSLLRGGCPEAKATPLPFGRLVGKLHSPPLLTSGYLRKGRSWLFFLSRLFKNGMGNGGGGEFALVLLQSVVSQLAVLAE